MSVSRITITNDDTQADSKGEHKTRLVLFLSKIERDKEKCINYSSLRGSECSVHHTFLNIYVYIYIFFLLPKPSPISM